MRIEEKAGGNGQLVFRIDRRTQIYLDRSSRDRFGSYKSFGEGRGPRRVEIGTICLGGSLSLFRQEPQSGVLAESLVILDLD